MKRNEVGPVVVEAMLDASEDIKNPNNPGTHQKQNKRSE